MSFSTVHPDRGSQSVPSESVTTGLNYDLSTYPESGWIICRKCGYKLNKFRHPKGWETGHRQASTQLNGAITAGGTTLTVDSNANFATPLTGTITAFASMGNLGTKVTDAAHGLKGKGDTLIITSTTNYNGTWHISDVFTDTFVIPKAYSADDATGTWTIPEYLYIFDTGVYSIVRSSTTYQDAGSVYTASTGGPRSDKVRYTAKSSTTGFTGCVSVDRLDKGLTGMNAHDDNMYCRSENVVKSGCVQCGTYIYE